MTIVDEDQADERAELHFLAALVDELMKALTANGAMTREQIQDVENAVGEKIGTAPRAW